jgi:hypothetical protein
MSNEAERKDPNKRRRGRTSYVKETTCGSSEPAKREAIMRTIAMLDAALRVWEAKNIRPAMPSVWQRRPKSQD